MAIDDRSDVRQAFENRFVSELQKHGTSAFATANILSQTEIKADRSAAAARLQANGADAVLVVRLVDSSFSYGEAWLTPGPNPASTDGWADYYHADMASSYSSLKQTARLETSLFDLKTAKRIWSGLTETATTETTDRMAEADKVVAKVVNAMRRDGMIK